MILSAHRGASIRIKTVRKKWADIVKFDKDTADRVLAAVKSQEGDGSGEEEYPF